ncbi:hypothetical protein BC628DRAFT_654431 [Trametes gibbosa]|nr:hypothetical protein BC628DRAFT_654431 [Trametes gibbosa]
MLLSHALLAVVCGGLLASARVPGPRNVGYYAEADSAEAPYAQEGAKQAPREDGSWQWVPSASQRVMGVPGPDRDHSGPQMHVPFPGHPHHPGDSHQPPQSPPDVPEFPIPDRRPPSFPGEPPVGHPGPPPPPPPGSPPDSSQLTIYQFLESRQDFSRLFKAVNYTEDIVSLFNDTSANITFFAVPDWALPKPPPRRKHSQELDFSSDAEEFLQDDFLNVLDAAEGLVQLTDGRNKKDRKAFLKAILKAILTYETLPTALLASELGKNVTFATSLTLPDGSLDGEALRIRVSSSPALLPHHVGLDVNVVSKIVWSDIQTKNGLIHVVNRPIVPAPSIFQIGFIFPDSFSTLTSALQRVGLTDAVEWREVPSSDGKHTVDGSPAVTIFAPTNKAFSKLPPKLKLFLFSPFGERALKKLLQFHIVPELVLHADYIHNVSEADARHTRRAWTDDMAWDVFGNVAHTEGVLAPVNGVPVGEPRWMRASAPQEDMEDQFRSVKPRPRCIRKEGRLSVVLPEGTSPCGASNSPHSPTDGGPHNSWAPHHEHGTPPPSPPPHFHEHGCHHLPPPFPESGPHRDPFSEHGPIPPPPPPFECPYRAPPPHHPPFEHFPPPQGPPPPPPTEDSDAPFPHPHVVYTRNLTTPTLLANYSLNVYVVQVAHTGILPGHTRTTYRTTTFAQGAWVSVADIPTRNGVLHIVDRLLNPLRGISHGPPHGQDGRSGSRAGRTRSRAVLTLRYLGMGCYSWAHLTHIHVMYQYFLTYPTLLFVISL